MEELIKAIVSSIVAYPDDIKIEVVTGEYTTIYKLEVNAADTGKIIGKQGNTADAIRTILKSVGGKQNKKVVLEIKDTYKKEV